MNLGICYRRSRLSTVRIEGHEPTDIKTISNQSMNQSSNDMSQRLPDVVSGLTNQRTCSISVEAVIETNYKYNQIS